MARDPSSSTATRVVPDSGAARPICHLPSLNGRRAPHLVSGCGLSFTYRERSLGFGRLPRMITTAMRTGAPAPPGGGTGTRKMSFSTRPGAWVFAEQSRMQRMPRRRSLPETYWAVCGTNAEAASAVTNCSRSLLSSKRMADRTYGYGAIP